jgi:hypothetical protein
LFFNVAVLYSIGSGSRHALVSGWVFFQIDLT